MTMTNRGVHPDLLDELEVPPAPEANGWGKNGKSRPARTRRAAQETTVSPPGDDAAPLAPDAEGGSDEARVSPSPEPAAPAVPEVPEWLTTLRSTSDQDEMIGLLAKHVDREALMKNETFAAIIGNMSTKRAQDLMRQQDQQRLERERQAAYDRGDLYTLGQMTAADLQAQRQQLEQQTQAALNPYMTDITAFQAALPESVQREVQGKHYDSYGAYLQAVHEARLKYALEDELKRREPALKKAELSTTVGSEMAPELDGGPAQQYREITDAQVAAMTLEEYDRYFDDKGRPRPGVRVRLERGIDVRREQRR